ncbi:MAG: hypothetical protein JWN30_1902 [Bacilli bacterium]|nr:hypothetical protein [Bacilli bacterium]
MFACPVLKVISFDHGEVRLYDFACVSKLYPQMSNVVFIDTTGHIVWYAELPSPNNLYIGMGSEEQGIWCGTLDSIVCSMDLATGKIIKKNQIH